jgi:predicted secreted hydrolase
LKARHPPHGEGQRQGGRAFDAGQLVDQIPASLDIVISALNPNAWMNLRIPYWEGPVRLSGSHGGQGYLEMTGY